MKDEHTSKFNFKKNVKKIKIRVTSKIWRQEF